MALDRRVENPPSWLGSFTKTGQIVEINDSEEIRPFDVYAKDVNAGDTLTLGTNGMSGACMNYTAFAAERVQPTEPPTEPPTDPPTEPETQITTASPSYGDANCDGSVNVADAVAVLQYVANKTKYPLTDDGYINADIDGSAGITGTDAIVIQKIDAGIVKPEDLPLKQ